MINATPVMPDGDRDQFTPMTLDGTLLSCHLSPSTRLNHLRFPCPTDHESPFKFPSRFPLLVAQCGGRNHQPKSVRPIDTPSFVSEPFLTAFLFSSLEVAMLKPFPSLLGTASGTCVGFYDKFQHEADDMTVTL